MANSIKESGKGVALQVTEEARKSGIVEETSEGEPTRRAEVRIHAFDSLLLIVDIGRVEEPHEAELVASAARDTKTAYRSNNATLQPSGNGYQIQLPNAKDAGLKVGQTTPAQVGDGVLIIHAGKPDCGRLADDLLTIRGGQY